jgi:hypothetical protein
MTKPKKKTKHKTKKKFRVFRTNWDNMVNFTIDHQTFTLNFHAEDRKGALWMGRQLRIALNRLVRKKA